MTHDADSFAEILPPGWEDPFDRLRQKWKMIPSGNDLRRRSEYLLDLNDADLLDQWERARAQDTQGEGFGVRGWYHELYRGFMRDKKVLDIGCGFGISTISFAEMGAYLTFVDIVESNVRVVERVCALKGLKATFVHLRNLEDLSALDTDYDVVAAIGSLINAPLALTKMEVSKLKRHLRPGGRWLHFAYPKSRWLRDGSIGFDRWGELTDGPGTPWMEYHDRAKLIWLFGESEIKFLFECEWHNCDFNWFDIEVRAP